MGPHDRTPPECPKYPPYMTPSIEPHGTRRDAKVCRRTPLTRNHSRIIEPLCGKLLLHQKERWEVMPSTGLSTYQ
jgi:hypothetical protein